MAVVPRTMAFKQGDVILTEDPWVYTVSIDQVDKRCYACLKFLLPTDADNLPHESRCSACKFAHYCSSKCQKADWRSRHKAECHALKMLAESGFRPPAHFFLMLKILLKTKTSYASTGFCKPDENSPHRTYADLVSHREEMLLDKDIVDYVPQIRLILAKYMGITNPVDLPPMDFILDMFGKVKCNSYGILDENMSSCGVGVYLNCSVFDHSCQPNACQVFDGPRLTIRATEDISTIKDVRISYIDRFVPLRDRREQLLDGYFFTCHCPRCLDPRKDAEMFAFKCGNSKCNAMIPSDERANEPCPSCQHVPALTNTRRSLAQLEELTKPAAASSNTQTASDILEPLRAVFHPINAMFIGHYIDLAGRVSAEEEEERPVSDRYFTQAAEIYRFWLPSPAVDPVMGWLFLQAAGEWLRDSPAKARVMLEEAERILRVTHGTNHPLYRHIPPL